MLQKVLVVSNWAERLLMITRVQNVLFYGRGSRNTRAQISLFPFVAINIVIIVHQKTDVLLGHNVVLSSFCLVNFVFQTTDSHYGDAGLINK